ncbi:hypothetical protein BOX15_Mlig005614g1 [Macrostomum lignano]|uniref:Uncharacterized protein n=1 Tax=Macrostomum lignano TaxID=282301 RepID=A0A267FXV9_9PLAT|nr:hypothetical protein BOX15_Mlig005614g1 [Macrostomum lignano]
MHLGRLQHLQQPTAGRSRLECVQINFLIPKPDSLPTLTEQHFQPDRMCSWTARASVQLARHMAFNKAIDTVRRRLGLGGDCAFYFNCLPEHASISGLKPLQVTASNTPEQEGLPAGVQVFVFVRETRLDSSEVEDDLLDNAEGENGFDDFIQEMTEAEREAAHEAEGEDTGHEDTEIPSSSFSASEPVLGLRAVKQEVQEPPTDSCWATAQPEEVKVPKPSSHSSLSNLT